MKHIRIVSKCIMLFIVMRSGTASAQDTITLVSDTTFVAWQVRIIDDNVRFRTAADEDARSVQIPLIRVRRIAFHNGRVFVWKNHLDEFDPTIGADSAQARYYNLSVDDYLRREQRREEWGDFWNGFLFWSLFFIPLTGH